MAKGIDPKFVHYGIRLSEEILKAYHAKKVDVIEMSDSDAEEIIRAAIQKVRQ